MHIDFFSLPGPIDKPLWIDGIFILLIHVYTTIKLVLRGVYTSTHVKLNLLNKLEKSCKMWGLQSILKLFSNEFDKLNNTGAWMLDSIDHMTLKSHFWRENVKILPPFTQRYNGHHYLMIENL